MKLASTQSKRGTFNWDPERDFYDVLRFQQHLTRLIWTRLFREARSRRNWVNIMKLAITQSKRGTFNRDP